jgi:hypothetical protein
MCTLVADLLRSRAFVCAAPAGPGLTGVPQTWNLDRDRTYEVRTAGPILFGPETDTSPTSGTPVDAAAPYQFKATSSSASARALSGDTIVAVVELVKMGDGRCGGGCAGGCG